MVFLVVDYSYYLELELELILEEYNYYLGLEMGHYSYYLALEDCNYC